LFKPRVFRWRFTSDEAAAWLRRRLFQDYIRLDIVDGKIPDPEHRILREQTPEIANKIRSEVLARLIRETIADDRRALDRDYISNIGDLETPLTDSGRSTRPPTGLEVGFLREIQIKPDDTPCALTWTKAGAFLDVRKPLFEAVRWRSAQLAGALDSLPNISVGTHALANHIWRQSLFFGDSVRLAILLVQSDVTVKGVPGKGVTASFRLAAGGDLGIFNQGDIEVLLTHRSVELPLQARSLLDDAK
jgi:hypothetical protein